MNIETVKADIVLKVTLTKEEREILDEADNILRDIIDNTCDYDNQKIRVIEKSENGNIPFSIIKCLLTTVEDLKTDCGLGFRDFDVDVLDNN